MTPGLRAAPSERPIRALRRIRGCARRMVAALSCRRRSPSSTASHGPSGRSGRFAPRSRQCIGEHGRCRGRRETGWRSGSGLDACRIPLSFFLNSIILTGSLTDRFGPHFLGEEGVHESRLTSLGLNLPRPVPACRLGESSAAFGPRSPLQLPVAGAPGNSAAIASASVRWRSLRAPLAPGDRTSGRAFTQASGIFFLLAVTSNHGKSAAARVNPRRRPCCWQPDSHGRWRSLRIGAAARPAPARRLKGLTRGPQGFARGRGP